jgi:hypothetical protein
MAKEQQTTEFPQFDVKLTGNARTKFHVEKHEIGRLSDFLLTNAWKGTLSVTYPGNGGISLVIFDETRRATYEENGFSG